MCAAHARHRSRTRRICSKDAFRRPLIRLNDRSGGPARRPRPRLRICKPRFDPVIFCAAFPPRAARSALPAEYQLTSAQASSATGRKIITFRRNRPYTFSSAARLRPSATYQCRPCRDPTACCEHLIRRRCPWLESIFTIGCFVRSICASSARIVWRFAECAQLWIGSEACLPALGRRRSGRRLADDKAPPIPPDRSGDLRPSSGCPLRSSNLIQPFSAPSSSFSWASLWLSRISSGSSWREIPDREHSRQQEQERR